MKELYNFIFILILNLLFTGFISCVVVGFVLSTCFNVPMNIIFVGGLSFSCGWSICQAIWKTFERWAMKTITTNNGITVFVDTIECIDNVIDAKYREEPVEWFRLGKYIIFHPFKTQQVLKGYEISFKTIGGRWYYIKYETKEAAEIILKALIKSRKGLAVLGANKDD